MEQIEEDYSSTCEPWLAQAGLLNQIGMQFSGDVRLTEAAQSMRSLLTTICRKVNCFSETGRRADTLGQPPHAEAWKSWVRKESMRRLAYAAWVSVPIGLIGRSPRSSIVALSRFKYPG